MNKRTMDRILLPPNEEIKTDRGLVIVGANGTGKTRLGCWIDTISSQKDITHRISAQKSLNFSENIRPMAIDKSESALLCGNENAQPEQYSSYKIGHCYGNNPAINLINDYGKLLVYLFSERYEITNKYFIDSKETESKVESPPTKLDQIKTIWEEILPRRELIIGGGRIQTRIRGEEHTPYNASEMSDGERIIFYSIGQCLAAKRNNIIVIDEPGLYLHKSIQYALWNKIEQIRSDCLFVYLTHDVEFASSRVGFKKIWLKDYDGSGWTWVEVDEKLSLPEGLLLEIYGSRKKVLLVEGDSSSFDVKFYRNIFNDFLVKPCDSCKNVITYTKSLRGNKEFHQLEVFGLIDKDRLTKKEIEQLEKKGIYSLTIAEVENLFVVPEILEIIANRLGLNSNKKLKEVVDFVIGEIQKELEEQISERATEELKYLMRNPDLGGKGKNELVDEFSNFVKGINPDKIYDDTKNEFTELIQERNYKRLLAYYNRKTIASRIGGIFGLKKEELPSFVVRLSQNEEYTDKFKEALKKYIPEELGVLI